MSECRTLYIYVIVISSDDFLFFSLDFSSFLGFYCHMLHLFLCSVPLAPFRCLTSVTMIATIAMSKNKFTHSLTQHRHPTGLLVCLCLRDNGASPSKRKERKKKRT
uniref:Uncharacterized protein n=1 Tax=Trypanosoma congolense (strain IL3000) TaxID=1068625 RepID=G0ULE3_TRYCI|nr:hypothetical protein, unlikely [Trypanosoma congolense IL3000]